MVTLSLFTLFINHLDALNYHSCDFLLMCDNIKFVLIILFFSLHNNIFYLLSIHNIKFPSQFDFKLGRFFLINFICFPAF